MVALAREFNPNILTFTVGYDVPGYSEIDVAQDSARHLDVTTIPTKIGPQDMMEALPRIIWHLDDPVADPALVPLYFVAKKAAEHVTVVLSGEGADEFFGGYTIYREPLSLGAVNGLPGGVQKGLRAVSKAIPQGVKGKSFLERGTTPIEQRYYGNARMFTEEEKRHLMRRYDPSVRYTDVTAPIYAECAELDDVTKMQYVDLYTWLRGDILVKADRISMSHSLEVRVPFLDKEVFEVAAKIPVELKLPPRSDATKYAMRQALQGVVPPAIVNRRKLGFPTPTRVWLRGEMYEWARNILATSGRRRAAGPAVRDAAAGGAQARGGRQLPQGLDRADLLHLARDLRGEVAQPRHPAQPVGAAHQAGRRLDGALSPGSVVRVPATGGHPGTRSVPLSTARRGAPGRPAARRAPARTR